MILLTAALCAYGIQYYYQYRALYFNEHHGKKPFYISTSFLLLGIIGELINYLINR